MSRIEPVCRECNGSGIVEPLFDGDAGPFFGLMCPECEGRGWRIDRPWRDPDLEPPHDVGC